MSNAPKPSQGQDGNTLSSLWDGLSDHLIASFYPVAKGNDGTWAKTGSGDTVRAPLTEASMEVSLNWQSPFENSGPESKAPALMAMFQSGAIQPWIDLLHGDKSDLDGLKGALTAAAGQFEGRSSITKLNSTQVFAGMPPVKLQVTALFRAWRDTYKEVEQPFDKLMEWALPEYLAPSGTMLTNLLSAWKGGKSLVDGLMPSKSPRCIGLKYKTRLYCPLVIESISAPLASPVDRDGRYIELLIPMTLCSLTAIDRADWLQWGNATSL